MAAGSAGREVTQWGTREPGELRPTEPRRTTGRRVRPAAGSPESLAYQMGLSTGTAAALRMTGLMPDNEPAVGN